jgi:diguanylate cyclase (GGDEF)-like protein
MKALDEKIIKKSLSSTDKSSIRNGMWIAALIISLCLTLLALLLNSNEPSQFSLENSSVKLHVASVDTDDLQKIQGLADSDWQNIKQSHFAMSPKAHWFKMSIPANKQKDGRLVEIPYANLDYLDVWFVDESAANPRILEYYKAGDNFAFGQREIQHDQLIFSVPESINDISLFLRVETQGGLQVPIKLWAEEEYIQFVTAHSVFKGIFYGFMAALAILTLFLFVSSRNTSTLLYTIYVVCLSLTLVSKQGLAFRYLWPESTLFQQYAELFFASLMVIFSSAFSANVLEIKRKFKRLYSFFNATRIIVAIYIALIFILPFSVMVSILSLVILMVILLVFASTVYISLKGSLVASYLAVAWGAILLSCFLVVAENIAWISLIIDPVYLLMMGAAISSLFMALALAMHFNEQRLDAKRAHLKARKNKQKAMRAKEELLRLQIETKEQLEYAVDERNYELEIAMRELNEANHELERKSSIDVLTGVANRRLYDKKILAEARRSRREKTSLAIAMIDIDHFKTVNDTYGHQCGDLALKHFADILKGCIKRPSDIICRYGGEEFVIILPNTDLEGARVLMESVRSTTKNSEFNCEGKVITFTVSIGVSSRVIATEQDSALLHAFADKLLYKAKEAGRNQVVSAKF